MNTQVKHQYHIPALPRASAAYHSVLWLLCLIATPKASSGDAPDGALRAYVEESQHRQAYGVYVKQHKLGYAIDELKLGQWSGKEVAVQTFEMHWRYQSDGETSVCDAKTVNYFELVGKGKILAGEEEVTEDGTLTRRSALREKDHIILTTRTKGAESRRVVPMPKESIVRMRELDRWLRRNPLRGSRFTDYSTEWEAQAVDQEEVLTVHGKKTILWGGVKTRVFLVSISSAGAITDAEIAADGTMIKGWTSGILEMRAEKEATARQPGGQMVDLLQASSIPVDKDLGEPEKLVSLTLEITGVEHLDLPESERQRVRWQRGKTTIVELSRDHRTDRKSPLSAEERERATSPTAPIQSDHPTIRKLAKEIVGDSVETMEQVSRLKHWVHAHIRQTMAANASTATDVLENRAGDCTELTLLFVSLARALGIPAREVNGVMFVGAGHRFFGWHAWAEIHNGHQWVSVDPTWDEVYVDATHLKVSEGVDDWRWVNVLGKVKFHVIKSSRAS